MTVVKCGVVGRRGRANNMGVEVSTSILFSLTIQELSALSREPIVVVYC